MAKQFDITTKHLIEAHPADWLALARFPLPTSPSGIHVEDSDLSTMAAADKIIRVDGPPPYIAHIEFQTGSDKELDQRILLYDVLCRNRTKLRVRSAVIFLRPQALAPGVSGAIREGDGDDRRDLWTATRILLGLRYEREIARQLLKGVQDMEESTTYQEIIETGVRKGRTQGERYILLRQGTLKFGQPDSAAVAALEAISDPEQLSKLGERLLSATSWNELLA